MKSDFVAPIIKTLFVPDGNPDIQEVGNISVDPRIRNADENDTEITISGDMQIELSYRPLTTAEDSPMWRKIDLGELDEAKENSGVSDEESLRNLEESFRNEEDVSCEENRSINLEIPFTLAVGKEVMDKEDVLRVEPVVQNVNWMLVSPRAIEFEAVLKLESEKAPAEDLPLASEEIRGDILAESIEDQSVPDAVTTCRCQTETMCQETEVKRDSWQPPEIKHSYRDEQRVFFPSSGFYQMRFYRVQWGEDLDAIAERLEVSKEIIKSVNGISEEEIKTGMLLSIPK